MPVDYKDLENALSVLERGGIILYPTDTIWGLGCDATNPDAVKRIFELKGRADSKAMISLVDSVESLHSWISEVPQQTGRLIEESERPLTIIFEGACGIAPSLMATDGTAAFRIPNYEFTLELCKRLGKPIVSTSANFSGQEAPSTFTEIDSELADKVDYVCLYGRDSKSATPSRIIKFMPDGQILTIRE